MYMADRCVFSLPNYSLYPTRPTQYTDPERYGDSRTGASGSAGHSQSVGNIIVHCTSFISFLFIYSTHIKLRFKGLRGRTGALEPTRY